jgi:hypothetical protein
MLLSGKKDLNFAAAAVAGFAMGASGVDEHIHGSAAFHLLLWCRCCLLQMCCHEHVTC